VGVGNSAVNIGNGDPTGPNVVSATGAFAMAGNYASGGPSAPNKVSANGIGVSAYNTVGDGNTISASGAFDNIAFNIAGNNNVIAAGPQGPLAIAGAIGSSNNNGANSIIQNGPGIKIK
jgi:hypothetical protein